MRPLTPLPARHSLRSRLCLGIAPLVALSACMTQGESVASSSNPASGDLGVASGRASELAASPTMTARPGAVMTGASIALMSRQYQPRLGATAGTGASAWVPAPPPPAFVATGPAPPADPPAPPPAAVANRQPSAPAARPAAAANAANAANAADLVRPEAAQPESSAPELQAAAQPQGEGQAQQASLSAADLAKGRQLFNNFSCGACHTLADAGGSGSIGPGLDRNPRLTREYAAQVIHDGRGAMPAYAGQISDPDIATLAAYIVQVSRK